jgi:aspartate aminotransferase
MSATDASNFDTERDLVLGGVSKSFAMTGWRVGWLRAPERIISVACKIQEACVAHMSCSVV